VRVDRASALHLTYCTNIHAADGWPAVEANIRKYAPALKERLAPDAPFGVGLRLAAHEARELVSGDALDRFKAFLDEAGLYVAIINGFPYGAFHGAAVKEKVYAPDWREPARVAYTLDLIEIVRRLVPAGIDAGVSTVPLTYKAWMDPADVAGWDALTRHVARVAIRLAEIRRIHNTFVHLDIEPEPDCLIETSAETVRFFERWLLPHGAPLVAGALGVTLDEARDVIRDHVRVCFDCCHFAVEFEHPREALDRLRAAGIKVGRIQLSSAIRIDVPADRPARESLNARLRPFADSTYLHQVVANVGEVPSDLPTSGRPVPTGPTKQDLAHFPDLDQALACDAGCGNEWRIHFHVPLFAHDFDGLGSTQDYVADVIRMAEDGSVTTHLEIETYTWDVLPGALKLDLADSIGREYDWVLGTLARARNDQ
jgi:sugar phosphate isomerase/epimerase